mmetsp:Transcript_69004/g.192840  ORF Transcript_69004/g.192840 Transcript_69004/m.192840 type:complete len:244 (+) Transcript_69004:316-1047(+)
MVAGLRAREGLLRVLGRASAQFHEGFALARLGGFLGHGGVQPLFRSRVGGVFSIPRGGSDGRWCVRGAQTGGTECTDTPQTAHAPQSARVPHPGCSSLRLTCLRGPSDSRVLVSSASSSAEGSDSSPLELAAAMSLRRASQCSTITRASEGSSVQKVEVKVWSLIKSNHVRHPLLKKYSHRSCSSSSTYCTHAREIGMEYQCVSAVAVGYRWRWQLAGVTLVATSAQLLRLGSHSPSWQLSGR